MRVRVSEDKTVASLAAGYEKPVKWKSLASSGGSNSMVESQPSKLLVASSILVSRSKADGQGRV